MEKHKTLEQIIEHLDTGTEGEIIGNDIRFLICKIDQLKNEVVKLTNENASVRRYKHAKNECEKECQQLRFLAENANGLARKLMSSLQKEITEVRRLGGKALLQSVERLNEARAALASKDKK